MRVRKSHKKVRSGCAQCKARRIKCDETKPKCVKCTMRNAPCSFIENPQRPTSVQTGRQDDSVRSYDPTINESMWYLNQKICERGIVISDSSFPIFHGDSYLNPCWSMSVPSVGLLPALQSNCAFTAVNIEGSSWSQTETIMPVFHPSLNDSATLSKDFSSKFKDPETPIKTSCQLLKDKPNTMLHSMWEDLLLFSPNSSTAMGESILLEPNLGANLESSNEQDAERTSPHGVTTHVGTICEHMESMNASTKHCTL